MAGTFVASESVSPWAHSRVDEHGLYEDQLPRRSPGWFVVVDGRGRIEWRFTGDDKTALLVLVCRATPAGYLRQLRTLDVGYLVVGDERVDLGRAMTRMRSTLNATAVITDGGCGLNGALQMGLKMASRNDFNELSEIYVVEFDGTVSDYVGPASQISQAVMSDGPMGLALFVTRPGVDGSPCLDTWAVRGDHGEPIVSISYALEGGCLVIKHRDGNVLRAYGPHGWLEVSRHGGRRVFVNKDGSRGAS